MFDHFCYDRPRHGHAPPGARGKWGWDPGFMNGFFGAEGRPRGRWRGGRMFEQGDLRYVVLRLLEEKPRHGYEIIKALEERFGGAYAPSPGAVYPTLQLLEDLGYARIVSGDEGKKVYEITDAGRAHLAENQSTVDSIFDRIGRLVGQLLDEPMAEVHGAFRHVGKATYGRATGAMHDPALLKRIAEILQRAAREIEELPRGLCGQPRRAADAARATAYVQKGREATSRPFSVRFPHRMSVHALTTTELEHEAQHPPPTGRRLGILTLTALGVVYGDIGTSPLYALRECFRAEYGIHPNPANIVGVLSLITWSLILVISIKYIVFILRADNRGEGGILALLALLLHHRRRTTDRRRRLVLISLGLFGAALLYGDGVITPAISVLGAIEGLQVSAPALGHFVVPISLVILFVLFMVQRFGTARVGTAFGPVMLLWFVTIATLGVRAIARAPEVVAALNPVHGLGFFAAHGLAGFLTLGAVVLVVTGGEALYADMGHFGKRPIRIAWFAVVLPALMLNYFGQGALLLENPEAASNPFYLLAPPAFQWPLLVIATTAAIVASQALISGAFSLTQQSVQLGYSPRMQIIHTSSSEAGQIYIPEVNKALMVGCLLLVLYFRNSSALSAAYGIAVTGTMAITSLLFAVVARTRWGWSKLHVGVIVTLFLVIDLSFLLANVVKIEHGGWVPLAMAAGVYVLMSTWKRGRTQLGAIQDAGALPLDLFLGGIDRNPPVRVKGTAVFMTSSPDGVPVVLLHHLKHNKVLHETVVLLSVVTKGVPEVPPERSVSLERLGHGFVRVIASYGFMQSPNIPAVLARAAAQGVPVPPMETSYYLGRERLVLTGHARMHRWRKKLFALMSRNARSATEFFQIPPNRVVELGAQIEF